jgi:hypothetical protein
MVTCQVALLSKAVHIAAQSELAARGHSCHDDYIDLMSAVPQKPADLLQRASRQVWAKNGHQGLQDRARADLNVMPPRDLWCGRESA